MKSRKVCFVLKPEETILLLLSHSKKTDLRPLSLAPSALWMYLGQGEDACAGGHCQLLLQVQLVGPGLLEGQVRHKAVHGGVAHAQGLLHALLKGAAYRHHLEPRGTAGEEVRLNDKTAAHSPHTHTDTDSWVLQEIIQVNAFIVAKDVCSSQRSF